MTDLDRELAGVEPGVEVVEVNTVVEPAWGSGSGGEGDDKHCKLT